MSIRNGMKSLKIIVGGTLLKFKFQLVNSSIFNQTNVTILIGRTNDYGFFHRTRLIRETYSLIRTAVVIFTKVKFAVGTSKHNAQKLFHILCDSRVWRTCLLRDVITRLNFTKPYFRRKIQPQTFFMYITCRIRNFTPACKNVRPEF